MNGRDSKGRYNKGHRLWEGNPYWGKGHLVSKEERLKMSLAKKGKVGNRKGSHPTEETRKKMSDGKKLSIALNPETHPNRIMAKLGKISKRQREIFRIIKTWYWSDAELEYYIRTRPFDGSKGPVGRFCDIGIPSERLDIEYDGDGRWHTDPIADRVRDAELAAVDWLVERIKE